MVYCCIEANNRNYRLGERKYYPSIYPKISTAVKLCRLFKTGRNSFKISSHHKQIGHADKTWYYINPKIVNQMKIFVLNIGRNHSSSKKHGKGN